MNIDHILNNRHIHDGNFAATATKTSKLQTVWKFLPLRHNIQTNALHLQAAHFMHIAEKHACLMNIDHILNNRRLH